MDSFKFPNQHSPFYSAERFHSVKRMQEQKEILISAIRGLTKSMAILHLYSCPPTLLRLGKLALDSIETMLGLQY